MQREIWRNRWLGCVNQLTSLKLQRESWLDYSHRNPHWSFVEFMCCYFDDLVIDNGYASQLKNGWISKSEFESLKNWHEALDKYSSPGKGDYDVEAILDDKEWQRIVKLGDESKGDLSIHLTEEERQILNEDIDYKQYV